jgi:membrane protein
MISQQAEIPSKLKGTRVGNFLLILSRILLLLWKTFKERKIPVLAQSLAYTTIFTLVPVLAIFYAVLGKVTENEGVKVGIKEFISNYILPEYVTSIFNKIENLSTDTWAFSAIGFPTLFLTGVFLYAKVDSSINEIWMSKKEGKWFKNGLAFFMTVLFGPMILVLVFSIPAYIQTIPFLAEFLKIVHLETLITQLVPIAVLFVGLFVLYLYIPATSVRFSAAFRGALTAAIIIQISNFIVGIYLRSFSQMDVFFGSLATIPIFLLWVYIFWLVVLLGAAIAFVHHFHKDTGYLNIGGLYNEESLLSSALRVLVYLAQCFEERNQAPDFDQLQLMLGLNTNRLSYIINTLKSEKIVVSYEELGREKGKSKKQNTARFQPGQSPEEIFVQELIPLFYHPRDHVVFHERLNTLLHNLEVHPGFFKDGITLKDLLRHPEKILAEINQVSAPVKSN